MSDARLLAEWFPEFAEHLDKMDETYKEMRTIEEKPINSSVLPWPSRPGQSPAF